MELPKIKFQVPDLQKRNYALGKFTPEELPLKEFLEKVQTLTKPIKKPKKDEWLDCHPHEGQTFKLYTQRVTKMCEGSTIDSKRHTIYLYCLDKINNPEFIQNLQDYCTAFFQTTVKIMENKKDLQKLKSVNQREGYENQIQFCALDIFNEIDKLLPKDGFCVVGITMKDLYIDEENNYVFGVADPRSRKGVFSFCRHQWDTEDQGLIFRRACKVLSHEICHIFGIRHCGYYNCLMQGSNSLPEGDKRPLSLCPICLRKLHFGSQNMDLEKRASELQQQCLKFNFQPDCTFYSSLIQKSEITINKQQNP